MNIKDTIYRIGGEDRVSRLLEIDPSTVYRWSRDNYIPTHARDGFIALCKKEGLRVTHPQLAECKKNANQ